MGLALLPWERLPAYVFGPLFCLFNVVLLIADDQRTFWHVTLEIAGFGFGCWVVWARYTSGIEPLWSEKQRKAQAEKAAANAKN